ncbi:hypothetical protein MMC07_002183 [Pseudocyphellaria aurata]|nr:hypothetical protein [Pseudocyphellaria aurata]
MSFQKFLGVQLNASADFHVHLRDGAMTNLVVPTIRSGGVNTVYVMPNLVPPVTTVQHALDYRRRLQALEPRVNFLMSLFLHETIIPETIIEAKQRGISGVKSYPAGVVTTNNTSSSTGKAFSGVVDYTPYYPVFEEMQRQDIVLNLHGECPSIGDITAMSAEERFIPTFVELHKRFPTLRIVCEHLTTAVAIEAVKKCGPTVAGTITAHHLFMILDDCFNPFCFCKPVAKTKADRDALLRAAVSGNPKFFFGSDSAPHPVQAKRGGDKVAAGVFTQPYTTQNVLDALEQACDEGVLNFEDVTPEVFEGFMSNFGRAFYGVEEQKDGKETIVLGKKGGVSIENIQELQAGGLEVVSFRNGQKTWGIRWV